MNTRIRTDPNSTDVKVTSAAFGLTGQFRAKHYPIKKCQRTEENHDPKKVNNIDNFPFKFNEKKKDSLNFILTDTISVLKIGQIAQQSPKGKEIMDKNTGLRSNSYHVQKSRSLGKDSLPFNRLDGTDSIKRKDIFKNLKLSIAKEGN